MRVFADISKGALPTICIIRTCQRPINIINCSHKGASLITEQGAVKEKCAFVSTSRPHEQNGLRVSWKLYFNLYLNICRNIQISAFPVFWVCSSWASGNGAVRIYFLTPTKSFPEKFVKWVGFWLCSGSIFFTMLSVSRLVK